MKTTILKKITAVTVLLMAGLCVCRAGIIAQWTYETSLPFLDNNTDIGNIAAEVGTGTASGHHASSATDWSNPVGNGSLESFNANTWASGDYFEFASSSAGYRNIVLTWDQRRNGNGPVSWKLQYGTDGTTFNDWANYTVIGGSWSLIPPPAAGFSYLYDLSSISSLNGASSIYFRLVAAVDAVAGGISHNDNFTISGELVPEPVNVALAIFGGIGATVCGVRRFVNRRQHTQTPA